MNLLIWTLVGYCCIATIIITTMYLANRDLRAMLFWIHRTCDTSPTQEHYLDQIATYIEEEGADHGG